MTPPTIEMESVTKRFGDHEAVSGLSLTVARGRAFGLLGPNGSGKSTTIRLLTGLLTPDAGTVGLFGERLGPRNADRLRTRIGVQTDTSLYDTLSARENLRTWGTLYGLRGAALGSRVDEVLELFGLTGRAGSPVGGFSKGMRQKLAIGRAVLHRPELLFLDEPTAGLDPEAAADLIDYLARMVDSSETTLVLSTHRLAGLETLCHDLAIILPAAVIALGGSGVLQATVTGLQGFLDTLPEGIAPVGYSPEQTVVYAVLVFFMAPFFLLIPVITASVTAASSIVGEKERRTIEGLLYTPLTNRELVLAKILGSVLPAVALTWVAFAVYAAIVGIAGAEVTGGTFFPTTTWIVLVVVLAPLVGFLSTSLVVAVSGRSTTVQGAQGVAVLVVMPILALVVGQATGLMLFDVTVVLAASGLVLVLDSVAFVLVVSRFRRELVVTGP